MYKVSKTKAGIKINGSLIGDSSIEKEEYLSSLKNNDATRPSLIREFTRTKIYSDIDLNINSLINSIPELSTSKITQEDLKTQLDRCDATTYNRSENHNWGNKAIAGLLNDLFNTQIFKY